MNNAAKKQKPPDNLLEPLIFTIREQRMILDADLARLYGVATKVFNQAVRRNRGRFPGEFAFQITVPELEFLRSQFVTSSSRSPDESGNHQNSSQIATHSHGGRRHLPRAFTEHGVLMAANILRSKRAVEMSVFVVRAFVRLREQVAANSAILKRLAEIDKTLLDHDQALGAIWHKLQPLLQPPPEPPKRRLGFRKEDR